MQDCEIFVEYDGDDELIPDAKSICPEILTASKVSDFRFIAFFIKYYLRLSLKPKNSKMMNFLKPIQRISITDQRSLMFPQEETILARKFSVRSLRLALICFRIRYFLKFLTQKFRILTSVPLVIPNSSRCVPKLLSSKNSWIKSVLI